MDQTPITLRSAERTSLKLEMRTFFLNVGVHVGVNVGVGVGVGKIVGFQWTRLQ